MGSKKAAQVTELWLQATTAQLIKQLPRIADT
jgi:hypothetical protein